MRAVLSIGSNMEDRCALLQTVFDEFAEETVAASPVFATPPWGVTDQDEFLNAVLIVDVDCTPLELLRRGQKLEEAAERVRVRHWGPRTLDVDVVQIDGVTSEDPELILPHPYAHERAFVLVPWLAADEHAELNGTPVRELIADLDEDEVAAVKELGE
ncbi:MULTISPECIES: 2-amino-4-hydroxy-6-hydroxymethyldihydropteridine diphosphokinase [Corynebacterium]|uniref:2-amino-4-hydroxy-6-hydroxymethyldihydropteridine pyrophosphokinase n=1 Tax=Corynebacterium minutissimum TaxID=38301 RepID=A0ACC4UEF8_9CORY|nr:MULTISPECIES: 2-amino-4-hydroxy-6-hydroxymethyldihydropteridine diphosphokinase [Corynebacterium]KKO81433.1 2-amino-4-hydroxy-6-hydroxymethyldihydropteridine pyrophosphokinase [Corynebacterium minutissimum]OFK67536.1 2-amino-4-hydroxy-6-hydroxymethyldihydropteridine diphosphokinase [Corynebacterium sp. HMSC074A09]OFN36250.1 2-amino-4-hydroxy-6-hydroxymethyldihydropteridine diphosphokinase [Corynebacterium sp. HMSC072A04]OFN73706.1 2-amino-4-hydroxy-6-hydroxymethyldihydropteridine diphosphoki